MKTPTTSAILAAASTAVLLAGCASRPHSAASASASSAPVASFDESGVTVSVRYTPAADASGKAALSVTFKPDQPGFHLYSLTMPDDGVQGLGRPIRVAVSGRLAAAGAPTADQPVKSLRQAGLDVDLPVYPDGPVTVTLPVTSVAGASGAAHLTVGYAACSEKTCLVPVSQHPVDFAVP